MVGYKELTFRLFGCQSLKDKRAIRQSIVRRVQNRFHVSIAEIGENEMLNVLEIGVAVVSNSSAHIGQTLQAIEKIILGGFEVELIAETTEWL